MTIYSMTLRGFGTVYFLVCVGVSRLYPHGFVPLDYLALLY